MADSLAADKRRARYGYGPGDHRQPDFRPPAIGRLAGGRDRADDAEPRITRSHAARRTISVVVVAVVFAAWVAAILIAGGIW
jgi:hypothetical protein